MSEINFEQLFIVNVKSCFGGWYINTFLATTNIKALSLETVFFSN